MEETWKSGGVNIYWHLNNGNIYWHDYITTKWKAGDQSNISVYLLTLFVLAKHDHSFVVSEEGKKNCIIKIINNLIYI